MGDTSITDKNVGNNTNNIGIAQSSKMGWTNIKKTDKADMEANKKADIGIVANINNGVNSCIKVIN